jgi:acyl carrier protein
VTKAEILCEVAELIRLTFGADQAVPVTRETVSFDIDGWDSLSHATLMIMIQRKFEVQISEDDSNVISNVGDLVDQLAEKLA